MGSFTCSRPDPLFHDSLAPCQVVPLFNPTTWPRFRVTLMGLWRSTRGAVIVSKRFSKPALHAIYFRNCFYSVPKFRHVECRRLFNVTKAAFTQTKKLGK